MGISAAVLDFYDDIGHEGMSKIAMPARLKNLSLEVLSPDDQARLSDDAFGLIVLTKHANVLRKFPVNDPGNAWLSGQYFDQNYEKMAFPARFVAARFIKSACDAYEVPCAPKASAYAARAGELESNVFVEGSESKWMLQKLAEHELLEKSASASEVNAMIEMPDENFALVVKNGDGAIIRKYAMPDAGHVKMAAEYFDKYAMDLRPEHRHQFAMSVKRRAEELDVDVSSSEMLEKWSSATWNKHVHAHLEYRKSLLPQNESARGVLDKLAAMLDETTPEDAAQALSVFDQSTGLDRYYDRGLKDPYASTMDKTAMSWSAEIDGRTITEADLRKVAGEKKLAGYLGDSFAGQFAKDPVSIFESLPDPEKVLIKQLVDGEA